MEVGIPVTYNRTYLGDSKVLLKFYSSVYDHKESDVR